jgi:ribonuclease HI
MTTSANFDGLCEPRNPGGVGCWGFIVYSGGKILHEDCGALGWGSTNNIAEYAACIQCLNWLRKNEYYDVDLFSDSMLVVNQVNGIWRVKAVHLQTFVAEAQRLIKEVNGTITWCPREKNEPADALSRKAYATFIRRRP